MAGTGSITAALLKKYDFSIQKKYGQNFLTDDNILRGIVEAAQITEEDEVLEIGPGLGALTAALLRGAKHVTAVEIDRFLIPVLKESLQDYDNLTLIQDDILKTDLKEIAGEGPVKVVANLPYYITTPVIMKLLSSDIRISSVTVMVQKEVAQRMQENPGNKSYGALSLAVRYYSDPHYIMTVSRNCFLPKPDVDSAVIRLDVYDPEERPIVPKDEEKMFRIIRAVFNQRRKTLINALVNSPNLNFSKEEITRALEKMEKPLTVRGESFSLKEFALLSDLL